MPRLLSSAPPVVLQALQSAGITRADCVVLGTGPGQPTDAEADARVLAELLQVLCMGSGGVLQFCYL